MNIKKVFIVILLYFGNKKKKRKIKWTIQSGKQARKFSYGGKDGGSALSYLIQKQQKRQD